MIATADCRPPLLKYFLDRRHWAEQPLAVELRETHISWVLLTDRFVYKIKKPVRFSFLDFSTLAQREVACREELRLNRRLAPDIYLDVVPITNVADGAFRLGGEGPVCEWVLKMRRLPDAANLVTRWQQHQVSLHEISQLGQTLTDFFAKLPPLTVRGESIRQRLMEHIADNQHELVRHLPHVLPRLERLHASLRRYVVTHRDLFDNRICDGRFVEGHGDLRPEHVFLTQPPAIIDCVEFSQELRQVDIVDELAFLAMECDVLGVGSIGRELLQHYLRTSGDAPPASLVNFYKAYRACVRAKVLALRAVQQLDSSNTETRQREIVECAAEPYLAAAERYLPEIGRGLVIIVMGWMGSGKSTLAEALAEQLGAKLLQTDALRRQLHGPPRTALAYGEGRYGVACRAAVYAEMLRQAEELVRQGETVVLDGCFAARHHRQSLQALTQQHDADRLIVECVCPRDVALERIDRRQRQGTSLSEGRLDLYDQHVGEWEAIVPHEGPHVVIETQAPMSQQIRAVLDRLGTLRPGTESLTHETTAASSNSRRPS